MRRALVLALLVLSPLAAAAQDRPGNYRGYAHPACPAPTVRIVALVGRVPEGVPKSAPRPSIEIVLPAGVEEAVGRTLTVVSSPTPGSATVFSCPVVGDCAAADSGELTISKRGDDGSLSGEFQAKWSVGVPRTGKFNVVFRDVAAKCE